MTTARMLAAGRQIQDAEDRGFPVALIVGVASLLVAASFVAFVTMSGQTSPPAPSAVWFDVTGMPSGQLNIQQVIRLTTFADTAGGAPYVGRNHGWGQSGDQPAKFRLHEAHTLATRFLGGTHEIATYQWSDSTQVVAGRTWRRMDRSDSADAR